MSDQRAGTSPAMHGVAVTFRRPHELVRSLQALERQTRVLDHLVIVDNAPGGGVRETVGRHPAAARRITIVDSPENLGPAGGIASGMETVLADAGDDDLVVVLDDDDPLVDERVVEDLLRTVEQRGGPDLGGIGLRGAHLDRRTGRLSKPARSLLDRNGYVAVDYLKSDWAPVYPASVIRTVGPFERQLFFGFDDLEYGLRLNAAGFRVEAHRLGRAHPEPAPSPSPTFRRSPWRTYYTQRNLLVLLRRHASPTAVVLAVVTQAVVKPLVNILRSGRSALPQCRMAWRAIADAWRGRMGRTVEPSDAKFASDQTPHGRSTKPS